MINPNLCTICDDPLDRHEKYVVAFGAGGDLVLKAGSRGNPVPHRELAQGVFSSIECLVRFVESWAEIIGAHKTN
jgi:hypothetical protein